jgi:hypothetical protein
MTALAVALAVLVALPLSARPSEPATWPECVVGVAEARVAGEDGRVSTRLIYAAAVSPMALRLEVVRAGNVQAIVYADERRLLIYAPGDPPLLHEGLPTREALREALGLPFCPAEVFHALRGGNAPPPRCADAPAGVASGATAADGSLEVRAAENEGRQATLRFSHFRRIDGNAWPMRVTLDSDVARATLEIQALEVTAKRPVPPQDAVLARARRVTASEMAASLGLRHAPPAEAREAPEGYWR